MARSTRYTDIPDWRAGDSQLPLLRPYRDGSFLFVGETSLRIHQCAIRHGGDSRIRAGGVCIGWKSRHASNITSNIVRNIICTTLCGIDQCGDAGLSDSLTRCARRRDDAADARSAVALRRRVLRRAA